MPFQSAWLYEFVVRAISVVDESIGKYAVWSRMVLFAVLFAKRQRAADGRPLRSDLFDSY